MKLKTTVKGIENVIKRLEAIEKENLPRAMARGLNATAFAVRADIQAEMQKVFDMPTRYILNSVTVQKADESMRHYEQSAAVFIKNYKHYGVSSADILEPHIFGGTRKQKRFEKLIAEAGHIQTGQYLLPYKAVKNAYGNVSPGTIQRILSGLQAQFDATQNSPVKGATYWGARAKRKVQRRYKVIPRHGKPIIWEFSKGHSVPLFMAVDSVSYKKRFEFYSVAARSANKNLRKAFEKELRRK